MASKNKDERAHVNALIKAIQKNSHGVYAFIDRDAGSVRHTSSGFDFILAHDGRVVFCEAKEGNGKLSDWQEFVRAEILASDTPYYVVRFWSDGKFFTVNDGLAFMTEAATITDFIPKKERAK